MPLGVVRCQSDVTHVSFVSDMPRLTGIAPCAMNADGMFLAKVWKTVNGKRYPGWVLKKSVWDKEAKRQKQIYVGYIGPEKRITWEKAQELCREKGVSFEELRRVKRLEIVEPAEDKASELPIPNPLSIPPRSTEGTVSEEEQIDVEVGFDVPRATLPEMVRAIRTHYGLGDTLTDYDDLAYKISPFLDAETLRLVEQDRAVLDGHSQEQLRHKWRWIHGIIA